MTQVNDRAKIIANGSGTCIRSSTATTTACTSSGGGNILVYVPAGQTRIGTVAQVTSAGGFAWFYVTWDGGNPTQGYVRTDVVQLDVPVCSWSQSPPSSVAVGTSFTVALSCVGNPTQWGWDFNGTTTSASNIKTFSFSSAGTYNTRGWGINAAGSGSAATALVTATAAAPTTPPSCAPSASATTIPVGNSLTLFANCVSTTGGGGGTVFVDWTGPVPSNGPTFANATTIQNPNLNAATTQGSFTYSVSAHDFYGYSAIQQVVIQVTPPAFNGVTLYQPSNNATGVSTTPSFSWSSIAGTVGYTLSIEPADGVGVSPTFGSNTNSFVWPANSAALAVSKQYKWRVQASGATLWSDYGYFTTNNTPPPGVVVVGPNLSLGQVGVGGCTTGLAAVQGMVNTGSATVTVLLNAPFAVVGASTVTITGGTAKPLTVQFCPTSVGVMSRTATITGAPVANNTTFTVSGEGIAQSTSTPTSVNEALFDAIGEQQVGVEFPVRIQTIDAGPSLVAKSSLLGNAAANAGKKLSLFSSDGSPVSPSTITLDTQGGYRGNVKFVRPHNNAQLIVVGKDIKGASSVFSVFDVKNFVPPTPNTPPIAPTPPGQLTVELTSSGDIPGQPYTIEVFEKTLNSTRGTRLAQTTHTAPGNTKVEKIATFTSVRSGDAFIVVSAQGREIASAPTVIKSLQERTHSVALTAGLNCDKQLVLIVPGMMGSSTKQGWKASYPATLTPTTTSAEQLHIFEYKVGGLLNVVDLAALRESLQSSKNPDNTTRFVTRDVPWDWRLTPSDAAAKYLLPVLEARKTACPVGPKTSIVAHSMGGFVARAYIQSLVPGKPYANDIDKLVMLATPNGGSANAYWMLEGGQPKAIDDIVAKNVVTGLWDPYTATTDALMNTMGYKAKTPQDYINFYRNNVQGAQALMSPYLLGDSTQAYKLWDTGVGLTFNTRIFQKTNEQPFNTGAPNLRNFFTTIDDTASSKVKTALFLSTQKDTIDRIGTVNVAADGYSYGKPQVDFIQGSIVQRLLKKPGDSTVVAYRGLEAFLDDPTRDADVLAAGCLSANTASGRTYAGCILPKDLPPKVAGSQSSVISIRTGKFGDHQDMFQLDQCVVKALESGDMTCGEGSAFKSVSISTQAKATALPIPHLNFNVSGDASLMVTAPSGAQSGQQHPQNTILQNIAASDVSVGTNSQIVDIDSPSDGTYNISLTRDDYSPMLVSVSIATNGIEQTISERINVFPAAATNITTTVSNSLNTPLSLTRPIARPVLQSIRSGGAVQLSWSVIAAAQRYRVYTFAEDMARFEQLAEIDAPTTTFLTTYPINPQTDAAARQFAVVAVDSSNNESFYSNIAIDNDIISPSMDLDVSSGIAPLTVRFTDTSSGQPTLWSWDFNSDGIVDSTARNPQFTYTQPGVYGVSLAVSSATQNPSPAMRLIRVDPTLTVQITGAPAGTLVSVSPAATDGTTQLASGQAKAIAYGAATTITAPTVAGAYSFSGWTGCATVSANVCTVTGTASITVTATYVPSSATTYTLSVNAGAGGATAPSGASKRSLGESVTVTATPTSGFAFVNWTGYASCGASASCTFAMPASAVTLTANFTTTPACTYSFNPTSVAVLGPAATTGSFAVVTQSGCAIAAPVVSATGGWLTASLSGSTVNFAVAANTGATSRSGTVAVGSQVMTITQDGSSGTCAVQPAPGKDTFFGTAYQTQGQPTWEVMFTGGWGDSYSSLVEIDVSALPSAAATQSATLWLYVAANGVNDPALQIFRITSPWTATGVTSTNLPARTLLGAAPAGVLQGSWYKIDITSMYRDWKNGVYPNYGVMLSPTFTTNAALHFATSESVIASRRPKLVVQHTGGLCAAPPVQASCGIDVKGNASPAASPDGVVLLRYLLGFRGSALTDGLSIAPPRNTAAAIESFLADNDYSATGATASPNVDGLILLRLLQGVPDSALLNGINLPAGAVYRDASAIRANVNALCGTTF